VPTTGSGGTVAAVLCATQAQSRGAEVVRRPKRPARTAVIG